MNTIKITEENKDKVAAYTGLQKKMNDKRKWTVQNWAYANAQNWGWNDGTLESCLEYAKTNSTSGKICVDYSAKTVGSTFSFSL